MTLEIFRIASDPDTSERILSTLSKNPDEKIRGAVALNESSNLSTLLSLVGDKDSHVTENLMMNKKKCDPKIEVKSCKNIILTTSNIGDAEFILSLRMNDNLNEFVSKVDGDLSKQEEWLVDYKKREQNREEFYFIIKDLDYNPLGTVRVYDFKSGSFCWGSWMINPNSPRKTAIESALAVYEFAFYTLGFTQCHFDVRNDNVKVINFHKRMGATEIKSNDLDTFFIFTKSQYEDTKPRYISFLKGS